MLRKRLGSRRGQSIIEYLVVAAAVIAGVVAVGALVTPAISGGAGFGTAAAGRLNAAGTAITTNVTAVAR